MGFVNKLYMNMPSFIKSVLISIYGFYMNRKRYGKFYTKYYRQFVQNMHLSREQLLEIQRNKLFQLLEEVHQFSPYYKAKIDQAGGVKKLISKKEVTSVLKELPVLDKDTLRKHMNEIMNRNPLRAKYYMINTSGTTGTPMSIAWDKESLQSTFAQWKRYYKWIGLPDKFKSIRFSGRIIVKPETQTGPFWVHNRSSNQLLMSTYHLRPENIAAYIDKINRYKPDLIDGYPSAIYIIAKYMNDNQITLHFSPKAVSTTAETLHEYQREEIERAFQCKVFNQYASSEGAPWIVECPCGYFHLWIDTGVFEFADIEDVDHETQSADLIITSFRSLKTPLIRYRIGDKVLLYKKEKKCSCGSNFPIIKGIIGRDEDILFTKEKGFVGRMDTAYKGLNGIFRSKIVQVSENRINVLIVPTKEYSLDIEQQLKKNLIDRLGDISIDIQLVDDIPLGNNGKFKAVESLVDGPIHLNQQS